MVLVVTMTAFEWPLVLVVTLLSQGTTGKVSSGHIVTREDWIFLDRFCFLSDDGLFEYEIQYEDQGDGFLSLLMYPDIQWDDAYKNPNAQTCEAKNKFLIEEKHQIIKLSLKREESGCEQIHQSESPDQKGTKEYSTRILCKNPRFFSTARERWWFIAISNCNASRGLEFDYSFRMTNGKRGDYWYEHFSADEFYILPCLTSFTFVYLFLLFTALVFAVELKCRQLFHVTYKLFLGSIGAQSLGIIFLSISYARFASTGEMLTQLKLTGRIFEAISEFLLVLLVLLLAKGYTVTRGRLRLPSAVKLTVFLCLYFLIYTFLFFFQAYFFDPGTVLYIYESPPGYGLLLLRILGWFMFIYAIIFTLKHFPEKGPFYLPFALLYSLWFISGPIIILTANHLIDSWVREKTAVIVEHFATFVAHIVFLFLTRPSAANQSFPYHVRTTQVGADLSASTEPLDRFDSHSYAPSVVDASGRTVDVFTVRGVLQRLEPLEMFAATGEMTVPATFKAPPPKYTDVFPHETPGQVAEMLKEEEVTSESDENSSESHGHQGPPATRESLYTVP